MIPKHWRPAGAEAGFSMIEALVALAVLGACLVPMATFVSQSVLRLNLAGEANARALEQQDILSFLETLNPMADPMGSIEFRQHVVSWTSRPILPPNVNMRPGAGLVMYSTGLYRVAVTVSTPSADPWFTFEARKVGYRRMQAGFETNQAP